MWHSRLTVPEPFPFWRHLWSIFEQTHGNIESTWQRGHRTPSSIWLKRSVFVECSQFHFNSQLNIDLSRYGASLSVPDAVFSDTKSSRVSAIVYRTLHKVLRLRNVGSGNGTSGSNIISATILPRPKYPLRKEIKLVFNHINQVLVIKCCSFRLQ